MRVFSFDRGGVCGCHSLQVTLKTNLLAELKRLWVSLVHVDAIFAVGRKGRDVTWFAGT